MSQWRGGEEAWRRTKMQVFMVKWDLFNTQTKTEKWIPLMVTQLDARQQCGDVRRTVVT